MSKLYTNAVLLIMLVVAASMVFSTLGPEGLDKAAFIFGSAVATGLIPAAMVFANRAYVKTVDGVKGIMSFSNPDFNVMIAILGVFCVIGAMIAGLDLTTFQDMVFEGVAGGTAAGVMSIVMIFAKKGEED